MDGQYHEMVYGVLMLTYQPLRSIIGVSGFTRLFCLDVISLNKSFSGARKGSTVCCFGDRAMFLSMSHMIDQQKQKMHAECTG